MSLGYFFKPENLDVTKETGTKQKMQNVTINSALYMMIYHLDVQGLKLN